MRFTPKSEDEINPVLPGGVYDYEVVKAEEKLSKKGNEMIQIALRVFMADGNTVLINDWLMEAMIEKLLSFCNANGLRSVYDNGDLLADDCMGKSGKVVLKVSKDTQDNDQNSVVKYVVERQAPTGEPSRPPVSNKKSEPKHAYPDPNAQLQRAATADDPDIPF